MVRLDAGQSGTDTDDGTDDTDTTTDTTDTGGQQTGRVGAVEQDDPEDVDDDTTDDTDTTTDTDDTPRERAVEQDDPDDTTDTTTDTDTPTDTDTSGQQTGRVGAVEQDDPSDVVVSDPDPADDPLATGIEQGGTETQQDLDRLTGPGTAAWEIEERAQELEQRVVDRTAADPDDVRIDIQERNGGLALVPVFGAGFQEEQRQAREIGVSQRTDEAVGRATTQLSTRRQAAQQRAEREATEALQEQTGRGTASVLSGVSAASTFVGGILEGDASAPQQAVSTFTPPEQVDEQRAMELGVAEENIETVQTDDGVRAQFTEEFVSERRAAAEESARESITRQIEEETGADLGEGDVEFSETDDGQIQGELTASGEEAVAVARTPLRDVPVVGGILTSGSRARTRFRQATDPAAEWWEQTTPSQQDVVGGLAAAAPVAAAEPTPFGEISLGTAAAAGGVVFGTAAAVGYARGGGPDETAAAEPASRDTLQRAATAELGEVPTPERPASEPFPTESPAPTRQIGEIFPTGSAPADTTDPFAPEETAPTEPSQPFGPEQPAPVESPEGTAPESPPIDPEVGDTVGGPAGFASPVVEGLIQEGEEETDPFVDVATVRERRRRERSEVARQAYEQTIYEQERRYGEVEREGIGERAERPTPLEEIDNPDIDRQAYQEPFYRQGEEELTPYQRQILRGRIVEEEDPGVMIEGQRVRTWSGEDAMVLDQTTAQDIYQEAIAQYRVDEMVGGRVAVSPTIDQDQRQDGILDDVLAEDSAQALQEGQAEESDLAEDIAQVQEQAQPQAQPQTPAQVTTPAFGQPPGFGTPPGFGFPAEPAFPSTPGFGYGTPPTRGRPLSPDLEGEEMDTPTTTATTGQTNFTGTPLGAGWFSEFATVLALGPSAPRGTPSQATLEDRPEVEAYTSTLPTEAQLSGTEEEQEAIEEARGFLSFGAADGETAEQSLFEWEEDGNDDSFNFAF